MSKNISLTEKRTFTFHDYQEGWNAKLELNIVEELAIRRKIQGKPGFELILDEVPNTDTHHKIHRTK